MKEFYSRLLAEHTQCPDCPSPVEVVRYFKKLSGLFFQDFSTRKFHSEDAIKAYEIELKYELSALLMRMPAHHDNASMLVESFFETIPHVYEKISKDIDAMFAGDPAAQSRREIVRSYPGFYAVFSHRIANAMLGAGITDLPRIISEYAHSKTGIDIHPGAQIGAFFCIDHGTGVVVGETCIIGDNVKLYQGVTLGALSVNKSDASSKRHPTLENGVVIYANATILGGDTIVGENTVIGGNVWITRSVPANSKVYYKASAADAEGAETIENFVLKGN